MASAAENKKVILHLIKTISMISERQTHHDQAIKGAAVVIMKQNRLLRAALPSCDCCDESLATLTTNHIRFCDRCAALEVNEGLRSIDDLCEVDDVELIRELEELIADNQKHVGTLH